MQLFSYPTKPHLVPIKARNQFQMNWIWSSILLFRRNDPTTKCSLIDRILCWILNFKFLLNLRIVNLKTTKINDLFWTCNHFDEIIRNNWGMIIMFVWHWFEGVTNVMCHRACQPNRNNLETLQFIHFVIYVWDRWNEMHLYVYVCVCVCATCRPNSVVWLANSIPANWDIDCLLTTRLLK